MQVTLLICAVICVVLNGVLCQSRGQSRYSPPPANEGEYQQHDARPTRAPSNRHIPRRRTRPPAPSTTAEHEIKPDEGDNPYQLRSTDDVRVSRFNPPRQQVQYAPVTQLTNEEDFHAVTTIVPIETTKSPSRRRLNKKRRKPKVDRNLRKPQTAHVPDSTDGDRTYSAPVNDVTQPYYSNIPTDYAEKTELSSHDVDSIPHSQPHAIPHQGANRLPAGESDGPAYVTESYSPNNENNSPYVAFRTYPGDPRFVAGEPERHRQNFQKVTTNRNKQQDDKDSPVSDHSTRAHLDSRQPNYRQNSENINLRTSSAREIKPPRNTNTANSLGRTNERNLETRIVSPPKQTEVRIPPRRQPPRDYGHPEIDYQGHLYTHIHKIPEVDQHQNLNKDIDVTSNHRLPHSIASDRLPHSLNIPHQSDDNPNSHEYTRNENDRSRYIENTRPIVDTSYLHNSDNDRLPLRSPVSDRLPKQPSAHQISPSSSEDLNSEHFRDQSGSNEEITPPHLTRSNSRYNTNEENVNFERSQNTNARNIHQTVRTRPNSEHLQQRTRSSYQSVDETAPQPPRPSNNVHSHSRQTPSSGVQRGSSRYQQDNSESQRQHERSPHSRIPEKEAISNAPRYIPNVSEKNDDYGYHTSGRVGEETKPRHRSRPQFENTNGERTRYKENDRSEQPQHASEYRSVPRDTSRNYEDSRNSNILPQRPPSRSSPSNHRATPESHAAPNHENQGRASSKTTFRCPEPFGFFADETQCDKYYECRNGTAIEGLCSDGLVFNSASSPSYLRCDSLRDVDCTSRPHLQPARPTKNCPRRFGLFSHETDCTKFWSCVEGSATEVQCPPGLIYDDSQATCNWADLVKNSCSSEDLLGFRCPERPIAEILEGVYDRYPHPDNCQLHFMCIKGTNGKQQPRVLSCNDGHVFDPKTSRCTTPEDVPGCENFYGKRPRRPERPPPPEVEEEVVEEEPEVTRANSRRRRPSTRGG